MSEHSLNINDVYEGLSVILFHITRGIVFEGTLCEMPTTKTGYIVLQTDDGEIDFSQRDSGLRQYDDGSWNEFNFVVESSNKDKLPVIEKIVSADQNVEDFDTV